MSMKKCNHASLDMDQEVLFCDFGGACRTNLRDGDCKLLKPAFAIGDRVRIRGPACYGDDRHIGESFTINDADCTPSGTKIYTGLSYAYYPASSLELVEPEKITELEELDTWMEELWLHMHEVERWQERHDELKVGDWVEVIGPCDEWYIHREDDPKKFRISEIRKRGIIIGDPGRPGYPASSLKKIPDQTIAEAQAELQSSLDEAAQAIRDLLAPLADERLRTIECRLNDHDDQICASSDTRRQSHEKWRDRIVKIEERLEDLLADYREEKQKRLLMADRIQGLEERYAEIKGSNASDSKIDVGDMVVATQWKRKVISIERRSGCYDMVELSDGRRLKPSDLIKV